jgi:hypothetical protein
MPFIPEEKIDRALEELVDMKEAVQIQTQAIDKLSETLAIQGQWLAKIHEAVTRKAEGDALGDLLRTLIGADKQHADMLREVLKAVQTLGKAGGG